MDINQWIRDWLHGKDRFEYNKNVLTPSTSMFLPSTANAFTIAQITTKIAGPPANRMKKKNNKSQKAFLLTSLRITCRSFRFGWMKSAFAWWLHYERMATKYSWTSLVINKWKLSLNYLHFVPQPIQCRNAILFGTECMSFRHIR